MDEAERLCGRLAIVDHGRLIAQSTPAQLIAREIEPQVIEIVGDAPLAWAERASRTPGVLASRRSARQCLPITDPHPLAAALEADPVVRGLQRRANLEDVFLKLTAGTCGTDDAVTIVVRTAGPQPAVCAHLPA